MAVDYHDIGADMVTHLQTISTDYYVTQSIQAAMGVRKELVIVLVTFDGFTHQEQHSLAPLTQARDATYRVAIMAKGDNLDVQDERLDDAVSEIEEALNAPGFPPLGHLEIERILAINASPKQLTQEHGLVITMDAEVRIIEEAT